MTKIDGRSTRKVLSAQVTCRMDEAGPGQSTAAKRPLLHHPLSGPIPRNRVKTVPRGSGFDFDTVLPLDVLGSAASPVPRHVGSRHCHSSPQFVSLSFYLALSCTYGLSRISKLWQCAIVSWRYARLEVCDMIDRRLIRRACLVRAASC
jgi:hypothetical protein